jgi:hypothetical protein
MKSLHEVTVLLMVSKVKTSSHLCLQWFKIKTPTFLTDLSKKTALCRIKMCFFKQERKTGKKK